MDWGPVNVDSPAGEEGLGGTAKFQNQIYFKEFLKF